NKTNIESAVRSVAGIAQFENQLVADDRLTMTVAQTLGMDERMSGKQIGVNVQQGFVYLTGMATDATMRLLVAQLAASVPQVRGIVNRIQAPDVVPGDAEETLIQPVIGQVVYATDGELGYVQKLIINPYSRRVSAVVVDILETDTHRMASVLPSNTHSPQKHQRLIPSDALRCAASGAIFLTLDSNQPVNFISFNPNNFVAPPVDWQPPYPYPPSDVLFSR
ncbi:MAG: BON domain-containing protein, partial [Caldilineaceae bacterium]